MITGEQLDRRDAGEPVANGGLEIANGGQFTADADIFQGTPAADCGGKFTAHETAADDTKTKCFAHDERGDFD